MPPRLKKLVGSVAVLAFIALYVGVAAALYRFVPDNSFLRLAYFAVVGMAWGLPIVPLIRWMNREPERRSQR